MLGPIINIDPIKCLGVLRLVYVDLVNGHVQKRVAWISRVSQAGLGWAGAARAV